MSTPESTIDEMDEQLFFALREIQLQMARLPFDELKARFTAVEERLAPQFAAAGHPDLALDARRLVAEDILSAALGARRPADECEQLLGDVIALGFVNLHHRAQKITTVCGFFSRRPGHEELINRYLPSVQADLTSALQNEEKAIHRFFLDECHRIRACLEQDEKLASSTRDGMPGADTDTDADANTDADADTDAGHG